MKKSAIAIILTFVSVASFAGDFCDEIEGLANTIMTHRQNGVSASTMINAVKGIDGEDLAVEIVKEAYLVIKHSNKKLKLSAVNEFSSLVYIECIKQEVSQ
jgi:hypothetical protein